MSLRPTGEALSPRIQGLPSISPPFPPPGSCFPCAKSPWRRFVAIFPLSRTSLFGDTLSPFFSEKADSCLPLVRFLPARLKELRRTLLPLCPSSRQTFSSSSLLGPVREIGDRLPLVGSPQVGYFGFWPDRAQPPPAFPPPLVEFHGPWSQFPPPLKNASLHSGRPSILLIFVVGEMQIPSHRKKPFFSFSVFSQSSLRLILLWEFIFFFLRNQAI